MGALARSLTAHPHRGVRPGVAPRGVGGGNVTSVNEWVLDGR